tara:strand:+ start:194 stop:568 length:375 start_codon:yes stop_codon:yes gene_type:complete
MATPKKKVGRPAKKKLASAGIGDTIKKFTEAIGIKACEGCNARARFANKAFPFNVKKGEMTRDQYDQWTEFKSKELKGLLDIEMDFIQDTYNAVNHTGLIPCRNCGSSGWTQLINNIDSHYSKY